MANFLDYLNPLSIAKNSPILSPFMGDASDPLAEQAKKNNQKGQFFDKNTIKGDARLVNTSVLPFGLGDKLNEKLDASQRQPSFAQLQQDPNQYPQFSSLIKQQPAQAAVQSAQPVQPVALGQNPANAPLQSMPDLKTLMAHPIMQQWLGSLPSQ
jgi:hypothetical protein